MATNTRPGSPGRAPLDISQYQTRPINTIRNSNVMVSPRAVLDSSSDQITNINTLPEEILSDTVEAELIRSGYIPLFKTLLDEQTDYQRIKYIKACNIYGEPVYIWLDSEGMCQGELCSNMSEVPSDGVVPETLRLTAIECNDLDVYGIAFECEKGICTLLRRPDNPIEFDEQLLINPRFMGSPGGINNLETRGLSLPYPIVRLSEIRTNPALILNATDTSFQRMRNLYYDLAVKELLQTGQLYSRLDLETKKFQQNANLLSANLKADIGQIEHMVNEYSSVVNPTDEQKRNQKLLLSNLRKRHEFFEEYLRYVDHYVQTQGIVNSMVEDLTKLNLRMESTINMLGKVLPME